MKPKNTPKVSVVIPNFNGYELLSNNLPSVINASKNIKNNILEVIVVDDGSTDQSVSLLTSKFKNDIKLIKHTKNRGFSAAVNTGVRSSSGDIICLLNTDVSPKVDFMEKVINLFDDKQSLANGIGEKVFAVSLNEGAYGPAKGYFDGGYIQIGNKKNTKDIELSFYVSGGSGLFRKSIWQELGGLDEKLLSPAYWEDIDICFRASKRGYQNLWFKDAHVTHIHESTVSKLPKKYIEKIRERNQLLMLWKNIHSSNLVKKHITAILKRSFQHPGYLKVILSALLKLPLVLKARQKEIKESVVSDEAVFQKYQ